MVQLSKDKDLPSTVFVGGKPFEIKTDFQYFINFSIMVQETHAYSEYDYLYKEEIPANRIEGFEALLKFAFQKNELPHDVAEETDEVILDYELDEDYIYSAFYQCYGIDLKAPNLHLHWYKFKALLNGLTDTKLNKIMEARSYIPKENDNAEYKKYMLTNKAMWHIDKKLSKEEQDMIDKFDALLK